MASQVLMSSDEESTGGDSAWRTALTVATSPLLMTQTQPIGAVWEDAHARLLWVSEMMEHLESAATQLTNTGGKHTLIQ